MRTLTRLSAIALIALAAVWCALAPAGALEPWRIVVRVQGHVESLEPGQTGWSPVFRSRRLNDGALARTLADSIANINLADQTTFRIGANTEVEMTKFQLTPEGRTVVFNLHFGKVQADVAKAVSGKSRFEVRTPNGVLAARGTEFSVTVMTESELRALQGLPSKPRAAAAGVDELLAEGEPQVTLVTVNEGTVEGQMNGQTYVLHPGDNAILGPQGFLFNPPNFPQGQLIPPSTPPPDMNVQHQQFQANQYQDPLHQSTMQAQFNHQYNNSYQPYMMFGGGGPAGPSTGPYGNGAPPLFNPTNTENPLSNTTSGQPNASGGTTGGSTSPSNTGRVIIIIR